MNEEPLTTEEWDDSQVIDVDEIPSNANWLRFRDKDSVLYGVKPANYDTKVNFEKSLRNPPRLHTASVDIPDAAKHLSFDRTPPEDVDALWVKAARNIVTPGKSLRIRTKNHNVMWVQVVADGLIVSDNSATLSYLVRQWIVNNDPKPVAPEDYGIYDMDVYIGDV